MTRVRITTALLLSLGLLAACDRGSPEATPDAGRPALPPAPVAAIQPHVVVAPHGAERQDEYYWLRDDARTDPDMLAYLEAENAYADAAMAPLAGLRDRLYDELVGRIKQDDASVPYRYKGYWYYTRFEEGQEYPVHARRAGSMEAPEEVMLDLNRLAAGQSFYQVSNWEVSPDQTLIAYTEDTVGRRQYTLRIRDLATGELLPDAIPGVSSSIEWAGDGRSLYYVENDPVTLLTKRVKRHVLGTDPAEDTVVYEETDDSFYMGLMRTRSEKYICIGVRSTVSSEQRCTEAAAPGEFRLVAPRERDVEYVADHLGDRWVVHTNWNAQNFKLMTVADGSWEDRGAWRDLLPHDPEVYLEDVVLFDGFMVVEERAEGLSRLRVLPDDGAPSDVRADEPAYAMGLATNAEPDTEWVRYTYTSLTTPATTYELNVVTGERRTLKEQPVLGGFDKANYVTERLWAPARDGARIPVSLVYRRGFAKDGSGALLQYGYGSYGNSIDPAFNGNVLSLVDRGMVYAIAHIRGGEEMGRQWYEDGKLLRKKNTFNDFVDVTRFLVEQGYAAPDRVAAMGGSAGGLLMGAVANQAPEDYRAMVSLVPFVDVVTTMLDPSIPLTTNEYDEWGNPEDPEYYDYMLSYSPYDQLEEKAYPAMFVGTGLWDSQVQYWEPAKYVARLRARRTDDNLLVFRTNMEAGHGGRSGRFQRYREIAEYYAFLLDQLGVEAPAGSGT
ncbi:S9 family peptidase [Coralloluteibacterium thermophilus]|uniref:S9 family peptidase n=1 Tax=Coralloluteibacterium thermophilum TaxID=2707049 RepID=A0ABV9NMJ4_9GAMM